MRAIVAENMGIDTIYRATAAAAPYDAVQRLPVSILLDNVRSMYNVGSFFRTGDAAGIERLFLCGITGYPPQSAVTKTAPGAEGTLPWEHSWGASPLIRRLPQTRFEIAAFQTRL